jgi:hypothetical protein
MVRNFRCYSNVSQGFRQKENKEKPHFFSFSYWQPLQLLFITAPQKQFLVAYYEEIFFSVRSNYFGT